MSTDLQVMESREIVITDEQTELIKKTICAEATDAEMRLFFYDCQRRGVHPLDKLIHFTKRAKKYTPITSIDFFRIRAHGTGEFDGEDDPVFELGEDGLPDTCKYVVYRKGRSRPWHATARWAEYYPGKELGFMWTKMPFLMLSKCAEALALRKAFPAELQGLYVKEEMDQAGAERRPLRTGAEMLAEMEQKPAQEKVIDPAHDYSQDKDAAPMAEYLDQFALVETPGQWADVRNASLRHSWSPEESRTLKDRADQALKRLKDGAKPKK